MILQEIDACSSSWSNSSKTLMGHSHCVELAILMILDFYCPSHDGLPICLWIIESRRPSIESGATGLCIIIIVAHLTTILVHEVLFLNILENSS